MAGFLRHAAAIKLVAGLRGQIHDVDLCLFRFAPEKKVSNMPDVKEYTGSIVPIIARCWSISQRIGLDSFRVYMRGISKCVH
jgi:hypothetical protein